MNKYAFLTELVKTAQEIDDAGYLKIAQALDKIAAEAEERWDFTEEDLAETPENEFEFTAEDLEDDSIEMDTDNAVVSKAPTQSREELDSVLRAALIRMEKANKARFGGKAFFFAYPGLDTGPVKSSEIEDALSNFGVFIAKDGSNWDAVIADVSQFEEDFNKAIADHGFLKPMDVIKFVKNKRSFKDRLAVQSPWTNDKIKPSI